MTNNVVQLSPPNAAAVEHLRNSAASMLPIAMAFKLCELNLPFKTTLNLARTLNMSKWIIEAARGIKRYGSPSLIERVRVGAISPRLAMRELYPNRRLSDERDHKRRRESRATTHPSTVVKLTPGLPSTHALSVETRAALIAALDTLLGLPRDEDVAAMLTNRNDRLTFRRAYSRMERINACLDL